jgi:hypothetical protein
MITYATGYWTARNPRRTTTEYIVIHHAGATYKPGTAANAIYSYHRTRWPTYNAAGYHIIIQAEADGTKHVVLVNDPWVTGAGVLNHNHHAFHICLADDFLTRTPDESWITAAKIAVAFAKTLFPNATVVGHRDLGATSCPGNYWAEWRAALTDIPSPLQLWVDTLQPTQHNVSPPVDVTYDETAPIMRAPLVSRERATASVVRAVMSRPYRALVASTVREIADHYATVGERVGIDYFVAMAQMLHETGALTSFWSQPPRHNLAGIGVTGASSVAPKDDPMWQYDPQRNKWVYGVSFPSYEVGVRAHLGRLVAYAVKPEERTAEQQALVDEALFYRQLPAQLHGSAPRWIDLNGKWAVPGTTYGQRIIQLANQLIRWV